MKRIVREKVLERIQELANKEVYLHMEMTMGAYTSHKDQSIHPASNFIKNVKVKYVHGSISETSPYRIGLKLEGGWVYAEGMTHWDEDDRIHLVISGNDKDGKLIAALQLSETPF